MAGLVHNSPDDSAKEILGIDSTIDNIRDHLFNWKIWPNFGDEGEGFQLKKYQYVRLIPGETVPITGTSMSVTPFLLSHSNYTSSAFLVEADGASMLYFGDTGPDEVENVDYMRQVWTRVAPLVREQMKIIRSYLPSNITIADAVDKNAGHILGEPIEIQQIIFNLCTNANHAMQPAGGALKIEMAQTHLDDARVVATGILKPGDYVRLSVSDTGCGMDESVQKRVFDPFFTTKEPGLGTGLGLSMVHGGVMRGGGGIDIKSAPGQGSQFDLYWPCLAYEQPEPVHAIVIDGGGGRRVLIVDDVDDFRQLLEASLTAHGFYPTAFGGGAEAATFLEKDPSAVDVALVDYMMPNMNGSELAQRLHNIRPDLPVVLMSGYSCAVTEENAAEFGFQAVLSKPVETARLVQTLLQCAPTGETYQENKEVATR